MTCDEFREIKKTLPWEQTRAVRSAFGQHYHDCENCRMSLDSGPSADQIEEALIKMGAAADLEKVRQLKREDLMDPEFWSGK